MELIRNTSINKQVVLAWNSDTLIKHVQIVIGNTYNTEDMMSIPTSISKGVKPAVVETVELELA